MVDHLENSWCPLWAVYPCGLLLWFLHSFLQNKKELPISPTLHTIFTLLCVGEDQPVYTLPVLLDVHFLSLWCTEDFPSPMKLDDSLLWGSSTMLSLNSMVGHQEVPVKALNVSCFFSISLFFPPSSNISLSLWGHSSFDLAPGTIPTTRTPYFVCFHGIPSLLAQY